MSTKLEWLYLVLQGKLAEKFAQEWHRELMQTGEPITRVLFARNLIEEGLKKRSAKFISREID